MNDIADNPTDTKLLDSATNGDRGEGLVISDARRRSWEQRGKSQVVFNGLPPQTPDAERPEAQPRSRIDHDERMKPSGPGRTGILSTHTTTCWTEAEPIRRIDHSGRPDAL